MIRETFPWRPIAALFALGLAAGSVAAQDNETWRSWNQPVEPFRMIGNIYYVGASDIASFLIATPEGHIVIDGGFAETASIIRDGIVKLGFALADVEILLNSHAHLDHAGGLAELKKLTGARLLASEAGAVQIEAGGKGDFLLGDDATFPAARVDGRLRDGEQVTLGGVTLTARVTPGHTQGCTSWTLRVREGDWDYDVVLVCSVSLLPEVRLLGEPSYPGIAEDFAETFRVLKALPCDVFLAPHGGFFDLTGKARRLAEDPERNPFIDPVAYHAYLERGETRYLKRLEEERRAASSPPP